MMKKDLKKWIERDGIKFLKEIGVKKDQNLLDFGCGEGHYAIPASKIAGKNGRVYALDKDKSILDKLKELFKRNNIENISLINGNSKIPLEGKLVDVVLCYDVVHYINKKERGAVYKEVHEVLKEEGLFSVYPKHHKKDLPSNELADLDLEDIIKEIEGSGFALKHKFFKTLLHDEYYNEGWILNFRKR
ncbi:MAG: class I SAM-dependent methyltransferase [Candidatus Omnitrophota bacterium]|nr:class I SAM-dependent methyltransferase [Candidatus Omnitrophota bacterium]